MGLSSHTLSWTTFIIGAVILFLAWLWTTRTRIGRNIIASETSWSQDQWSKILLTILITLFILVNPVFHLLAVGILGLLYFLLVTDRKVSTGLFNNENRAKAAININNDISNNGAIALQCTSKNKVSMIESKNALEKAIFSFPYIQDDPFPLIHYLDGKYSIKLHLSSEKYLASLVEYLRHSGFETELTK